MEEKKEYFSQYPLESVNLEQFDDKEKEIIKLKLSNMAITVGELATRMNVSRDTVSKRMQNPALLEAISYLNLTVYEKIMSRHTEILERLWDIADKAPDPAVKTRVLTKFLDKLVPDKKEISGQIESNVTVNIGSEFIPDDEERR